MSNQVTISTQESRKVVKGVIIGNYFLTQTQFAAFFDRMLNEQEDQSIINWRTQLYNELCGLINNYTQLISNNPMLIYTIWEDISLKYFKNTKVNILTATGLENEKTTKIYGGTVESTFLSQTSKNKETTKLQTDIDKWDDTKEANQNIITEVAQNILINHYGNMKNTIINKHPDEEDLATWEKFRGFYNSNKYYSSKDDSPSYLTQVFGTKGNYGQIFEAYIHHLAHLHGWYLQIKDLKEMNKDVKKDEEKDYFLTNLHAAKNWYSYTRGGDVVIVDKNWEIITNVQIKGSKNIVGSKKGDNMIGNPIARDTAKNKYLIPWRDALEGKINVDTLYDKLMNEAWIDDNVNEIVKEVDKELIDKVFNKILGKSNSNE